jgi:hypothetical protein
MRKKMKKMMKLIVVVVALMAANAMAYTQINFVTDLSDGAGGLPANDALYSSADNSTPLSANSLFIVYYSLDNSTSGFNNENPYAPIGDEYIGAFTTGITPGEINNAGVSSVTLGTQGTTGYGGGYVYVAIFNVPYSGGPTPSLSGAYYGLGGTRLTTDFQEVIDGGDPAPTPTPYGTSRLETTPVHTTSQVVPEPSSFALLGLGLGLVAWRRMRK